MENTKSKIKNFFSKSIANRKFKNAGPGRKLTDEPGSSQSNKGKKPSDIYVPVKRDDLTSEAKKARDAAIERFKLQDATSGSSNYSLKRIREQARKELEDQHKAGVESTMKNLTINSSESSSEKYSVDGVFFRCPLISDEVLPKKEWIIKIREFLYEQMPNDPGLTACLIIKNCNTIDRANGCIDTIKKYISNIVSDPTEAKYHKIRMSNRIFSETVHQIEGAMEFMKAAGFNETICDNDNFLIWSPDFPIVTLIQLCDALDLCEVITLEIDRNATVLLPSQAVNVSLPPDFFRLTKDEILHEQTARTTAIEEAQILKTKAMREKEQERYFNKFKYTLIRIRFPDGLYLQGTFGVHEKLAEVFEFVIRSLEYESAEFSLISPDGMKFLNEDSEKTLSALRLVPNSILKFSYENESKELQEYLKQDYLMLIQSM